MITRPDPGTPEDPVPYPASPPAYVPMEPDEVPEESPGPAHNPGPNYPGPPAKTPNVPDREEPA